MTKGRMTEIVRETNALDQVFVAAQGTRQRPPNLSNFQRVGESGAEVITFVVDENLRLIFEPPKRGCVKNTVPVALKSGAIIGLAIQIGAPFRVPAPYAIGRKAPVFNLFQMLAGEVHGSVFQTITSLRATEASEVISHYIT
jgi:hypothetical protein